MGWRQISVAEPNCGLVTPHACYVELFAGAAWTLFAKPPSDVEIAPQLVEEIKAKLGLEFSPGQLNPLLRQVSRVYQAVHPTSPLDLLSSLAHLAVGRVPHTQE